MSNDLISRKEALERLRLLKRLNTTEAIQIVISVAEQQINNCKTAFDKEKVILELSKKRYEALKMRDDENTSCTTELKSFWHSRLEAYTLAIEVIEKGGIE